MSEFPTASVLHALAETRVGDGDEVTVDLFREAMSNRCGEGGTRASARPSRWVSRLLESEAHLRAIGQLPREHTRNPATLPAEERRLAEWGRRQREQWDRLTEYQRARLEVSPAFTPDRHQAKWDAQLRACARFVAAHQGRLPELVRPRPEEFALARWWHRQLSLMAASRLTSRRAAGIEELLTSARLLSVRAGRGGQFRPRDVAR